MATPKAANGEKNILSDIGLLVTQTHRPDESLVLDGPTSEVVTNKGGLGNHTLPRLLVGLLSGVDNLEHLLLTDTLNLRQGNGELSSLLRTLILDSTGQSLGIGSLRTVEQVLGQRSLGRLVGSSRLDVLLFLCLDALLHLNLLLVTLLLVQLGSQTSEVLGIVGGLVALTSLTLADALIVVETLTVLLLPALDVPVLCGLAVSFIGWLAGRVRTRSEAVGERNRLVELIKPGSM